MLDPHPALFGCDVRGRGPASMEILPGDNHFLALSGIVTVGLQLTCFFIAYICGFDKITDLAGSLNFVLVALLTLCGASYYSPRAIMITAMVVVCVSASERARRAAMIRTPPELRSGSNWQRICCIVCSSGERTTDLTMFVTISFHFSYSGCFR